jgi:hypothetical protein
LRKKTVDYIRERGGKESELREEQSRRTSRRTVKEDIRVGVRERDN